MKDVLAEKLLAQVMHWSPQDVARERPMLQAMASFKYDGYEQYSPGMRFVETLALWLSQFEASDRPVAYKFITERLIFCSSAEMNHLVETAYPDHIRPILLESVAEERSLDRRKVGQVVSSMAFRVRQRQCLFLGLSDGARIDGFRRANRELDHEQIWQTHELSQARVNELLDKLATHVQRIDKEAAVGQRFRTIVLLDDFSASGTSYFMQKAGGGYSGKVAKFLNCLMTERDPLHSLCAPAGVEIIILIYVATEVALDHLRSALKDYTVPGVLSVRVETVQPVPLSVAVKKGDEPELDRVIERYYDDSVFDVHFEKGATEDARYGYASGGLPIVLHHNTPNNSLALLWSYEGRSLRGLFPRVRRHKEMS